MVEMYKQAEYVRLRAMMRPDIDHIDRTLVELPDLIRGTAEIAGEAARLKDAAEFALKVQIAIIAGKLREEFKMSDTKAMAEAPVQPELEPWRNAVDDAKASANYWNALVEGARAKLSVTKRLSDLLITGYLTSNSTSDPQPDDYASTRDAMAARRQSAPARRRQTTERSGTFDD